MGFPRTGASSGALGGGLLRTHPPEVAGAAVNWICDPNNLAAKWDPDAAEILRLTQEGGQILGLLRNSGDYSAAIAVAGQQLQALPSLAAVVPAIGGGPGNALAVAGPGGGLPPGGGPAPGGAVVPAAGGGAPPAAGGCEDLGP